MVLTKPSRIVALICAILVGVAVLVSPVRAAATASPLFMSFEDDDTASQEVAKATTASKKIGFWYGNAPASITSAIPAGHSGKALQFLKGKSAAAWSGFTAFDAVTITDATKTVITMDYYSPDNTPVMLKLESADGKAAYRAQGASVGWNQLSFNFTGATGWSSATTWTRLAIIPNFKADDKATSGLPATTTPNDQQYFIDNISVNGGTISDIGSGTPSGSPTPTPTISAKPVYMNFETADGYGAAINSGSNGLGAFEGGTVQIATSTGGHSDKALKFTKVKTGQQWSGFNALLTTSNVRVTTGSLYWISFDYYSSDTTPVMVKILTADDSSAVVAKTVSVGWNSLSFDMTKATGWDPSAVFTKLAIFPDFGVDAGVSGQAAPNGQVYYLDNISINGGTLSDVGSPSGNPTPSPEACVGKTSIRLVSPDVSGDSGEATGWDGVWQYNDAATVVYTHYYPVGSTINLTYQVKDASCNPVAKDTRVYLAVNSRYSGAQTTFTSAYRGSLDVVEAIEKGCTPPYCAGIQTVISRVTDSDGKVTFTLVNTNKTSTEAKPENLSAICPKETCGTWLSSSIVPSLFNYNDGTNLGAGGNNKDTNEAVDKLLPHFVTGMASVTAPDDTTGTTGVAKALTFTVRDDSGALVQNKPVSVITDEGGVLTSPDSSAGSTDEFGFTTVTGATTNANGEVTVMARASAVGTQNVSVVYAPTTADASVSAVRSTAKITWSAPVIVKVAQTIGTVLTKVKLAKTITLPAKTSKALVIKWTTSTPKYCTISAGKVKGIKLGVCKISGTNAGSATVKPVTKALTITVIR